jgi:hypothetical protein
MTLPLQKFEPTKFLHNYFCKVAPIPLASIALQIVVLNCFLQVMELTTIN